MLRCNYTWNISSLWGSNNIHCFFMVLNVLQFLHCIFFFVFLSNFLYEHYVRKNIVLLHAISGCSGMLLRFSFRTSRTEPATPSLRNWICWLIALSWDPLQGAPSPRGYPLQGGPSAKGIYLPYTWWLFPGSKYPLNSWLRYKDVPPTPPLSDLGLTLKSCPHVRAPHGISWGLCCDCFTAEHLPKNNP